MQPPLALTAAEDAVLTVPLGKLVVVMVTLDTEYRDANTSSNREGSQDFITPCLRDNRIPNRYRRFGTFLFASGVELDYRYRWYTVHASPAFGWGTWITATAGKL